MTTPIALITGANQGIGLATANRLAKEHRYHVIIASRNSSAGASLAASLEKDGHKASSVQLDVTSDASIAAAAQSIEKQFGYLDILINNAGILIDPVSDEMVKYGTRELFQRTFETNVVGTACVTEAMVPLLRKAKAGPPRVVFVSSRMGSLAQATVRETMFYGIDYKCYDASKAAVNMLALNYSRNLADTGARVNVVCPQLVATSLTRNTQYGISPYDGAQRIVEMATIGADGPMETFTDKDGPISW